MPRSFDPFLMGQLPRSHDPSVRINSNTPKITLDLEDLLNMYRDWWVNIGFPLLEELTGVDLSVFLPIMDTVVEALKTLFGAANILSPDFDPIAAGIYFIENILNPTNLLASVEAIVGALTGLTGGGLGLELLGPLAGLFGSFLGNGDGTITGLLDDLFLDNGDGTWSFIENGLHGLFDGGDGTLSSPIGLLQNLIGQLGTHQATMDRQQTIIDSLFNSMQYTNIFGNQVESLLDVLRNIPSLNVGGVAGPANIGASVLSLMNELIGGFVGLPGSGASLADLFNIGNYVSGGSFLGRSSFDILGNRANKSFLTGMLPSSVSPTAIPYTGTTPSTFGVTASTATTLWHRFQESMSLGVVRWWGQTTTSITDMRVAIKKMDPATGDVTLVHESANIVGDVANTLSVNKYEIPAPVAVAANEVYGAELSVRTGAGTYQIVGSPTWMTNDPNVFPRRMSSTRNPGGAAHPSTIASGSVTYASNVPHMEFAVDLGVGVEYHDPLLEPYTASGSRIMPTWANFVEVVVVGSGGGAESGSAIYGNHGNRGLAGAWATATWARGTDFTGTPTITITIPPGGNNGVVGGASGTAGGNVTVAISGHTVTGTGGAGGVGPAGIYQGQSAGNQTYGINPTPPPYIGGGTQNTAGGQGSAPGGGGAGGGYFQNGGVGAKGAVWLRFRQT